MGNNGITDALAAYAAEMSYEKLDPETIRVQKYSLLDAIACMAAATGIVLLNLQYPREPESVL